MATTQAIYRDADLPIDAASGRPPRADDRRGEGRPAGFRLVLRARRRRPTSIRRAGRPPASAPASARSPAWPAPPTSCADEVAAVANEIQRFLLEETRLGIPAILHEEIAPRPARPRRAVVPAIDRGGGRPGTRRWSRRWPTTVRRRMLRDRAPGTRLAPVLDVTRDPRWGRIEETYGEDPYLAAELGCAYIRGLQGDGPERRRDGDRQAHGRPRPGGGRPQPGAGPPRSARDARRTALPVRGGRPDDRHRRASCRPTATSTASRATPRMSC